MNRRSFIEACLGAVAAAALPAAAPVIPAVSVLPTTGTAVDLEWLEKLHSRDLILQPAMRGYWDDWIAELIRIEDQKFIDAVKAYCEPS